MPYSAPTTPTEISQPAWPFRKITFGSSKKQEPNTDTRQADVFATSLEKPQTPPKDIPQSVPKSVGMTITPQLKDKSILSSSPQLSTSPRRMSSPEVLQRKFHLKMDMPPPPPLQCFTQGITQKKNGEIVKSSLRKDSKSAPVTPTCPKYVHFDTDLEHVCFFLEQEKPLAVSRDASSEEEDSDDDVVDDSDDDDSDEYLESDEEEGELVITNPNFPRITTCTTTKSVFVESVSLSKDKKQLQGRVQVQNIAFHKTVVIRYTFDVWQTFSETIASYSGGAGYRNQNFDVFVFSIDLIDNSRNSINGQTMYFAVRYTVDNQDMWDNNNGSNYQVDFNRVPQSQKSKRSSSCRKPTNNSKKSFDSYEFSRSPPSLAATPRAITNRYDITQSLSAAQSSRPNPVIPTPPSHYASDFSALFPNHFIDGMPGTTVGSPTLSSSLIGDASRQLNRTNPAHESAKPSTPIAIPSARSNPMIGPSCEFLERFCFYQGGSPHLTYASASSPPVIVNGM